MRRSAAFALMALVASLGGCASAWISEPSPTTASLINDLKLEGFKCAAGFSTIQCRQIEPFVEKSPKICSSEGGCVKQPCHDVRIVYAITQARDGIPGIVQSNERTVTRSIPTGDTYSLARIAELKEYCALN